MFAGHIAVGLALGRAEPRINVGVFVAAALWLDLALWSFVLLGWESVAIPADFASTHQPAFTFPYSHGLAASLAWALALGASAAVGTGRIRIAAWVAAAVFSHWLLDALVHRPELPITGAGSVAIGLGLWQYMALALGV